METADLYIVMLVLGQVVPQITDIVNKHVPSARIRWLASWLMPLVIATMANIERLRFGSLEEWGLSLLILMASSQGAYKFYYEGSTWQNNIRFNAAAVPLKQLVPPVELLAPKLESFKDRLK